MAAAAIPLVGAGIGAIGGIGSTIASNKGNKGVAQMNNAFNEKMLEKQMAFDKEMYTTQVGDQWKFYNDAKQNSWDMLTNQQNYQTEMWNKQNEYNTPEAQRQRFEAAGLNPYMMMNGGSAGVAGSVSGTSGSSPGAPSAPGALGVNPPTASPYSLNYSGITEGLGMAVDALLSAPERDVKRAEADNLRIEGKYKAAKMVAEIADLKTNARTKSEQMQLNKLIASFDNDLKTSQMEVNNEKIGLLRTQTRLTATQDVMLNTQLNFLSQEKKMQLALGAADLALKKSQKGLTDKQAAHEIEKLSETVVRANGQAIQNQYNSETYRTRVRSVRAALWNAIISSNSNLKGVFVTRSSGGIGKVLNALDND
uniref:DNA pilot protein n=1 Tax=Dulem virus 231 TaxID=3145708 RepID=A0AAU8AVU3_9VIRU